MITGTAPEGVHSDQNADELRDAMVDEVIVSEWLGLGPPREIEAALRTVPRHLFAPGVPLDKAYADDSIVTKRNERGGSISSVSAPWLQSRMLGQLQVVPGQRVLEIGSGGYNAALLRELVGPEGSVTTIDIDQEIVDRARACLATAGYRDVRVVCGDGEFGAAQYGPFDRIIVTAGGAARRAETPACHGEQPGLRAGRPAGGSVPTTPRRSWRSPACRCVGPAHQGGSVRDPGCAVAHHHR